MPADDTLPEGTDHIINGAGVTEEDDLDADGTDAEEADETPAPAAAKDDAPAARSKSDEASAAPISMAPADLRAAFFDGVGHLRDQAGDKARDAAQAGKDRAVSALDDVIRSIEDAAAEIDAKIGTQYGDYARRAADGIGGVSEAIKAKDIDALFDDARGFLRRSPGVAIGAAAAIGFVVARLARAGVAEAGASAEKAA